MLTQINEQDQTLRKSEARLHTIVENLAEGVAVSDLDGQLRHFNRAALHMLGFTTQEECNRHLAEFGEMFELSATDGTVWPLDQWPLSRILRGDGLRDLEACIRRTQGNWQRVFSYGGTLVRDADGQPMMAIVTMRDITERKQADSKLQAQLARLDLLHRITHAIGERQDLPSIFQVVVRSLEDNLHLDFGCICLFDPAAKILTVTRVGVRGGALAVELAMTEQARIPIDQNGLSRCVRGELVYEPDISMVPFPFAQRLTRGGLRSLVAAPLLVESKVFGVLLAARRQDHSFSSADCEFLRQLSEQVALAAHQAQLYGTLQQAYDDLRQTQHTVMQQERLRALGQMASGIAHDINNAISPVTLYTESLLEREPNLSERARDYLTTIQRAIEDVAGTVAGMREFYRQREPQLVLAPIDLNLMVQQVIDLTRARWSDLPQQRGIMIKLQTELMPDLPNIMGAQGEIRDALTNLVFNAVDAMPEGGTLTLRSRIVSSRQTQNGPTKHVRLEVCDTGVGMDEETRRRCLEPFYTTKGERGTGLGLAMVYGMVERHSAEIELESEPGKGTAVCLIFPVSVPIVDSASHIAAPLTPTQRLRLLLVDDDPLLIKSLRDILESDGHFITAADGGQAGIDALAAAQGNGEAFAAVITDLGMPYVDGRKVAAAVKAASPSTPVIMLTGWGQRLIAEHDVPPHVDRVLSKPPKLQELRATLAELTLGIADTKHL
jgi:PAS domain S-box-containing protein